MVKGLGDRAQGCSGPRVGGEVEFNGRVSPLKAAFHAQIQHITRSYVFAFFERTC